MNKEYHVQCLLQNGSKSTVRWIPSKYAKSGNIVDIDNDGIFESGWMVLETYTQMLSENIDDLRKYAKDHRKATDI